MPEEDFLPLARPDLGEEEIAAVVDTLRSGWLTHGPKTHQFEEVFRQMVGAAEAVGVNSCTAGMHLALLAAGIGPGDEVITTPLTFAATVNVIVHAGATPVLADVCADDLNIDPEAITRRLTSKTKAVMPVHYGGQACRMDEILDLCRPRGIKVIEDAAHAAGARYKDRAVGSLGDATVFSFYAIKNMTTGQGGMVTTDDPALAERMRVLRNHGMDTDAWSRYTASGTPFYTVTAPGFNYGMTDLQASLGLVQMRRLAEFNARRSHLAGLYTHLFEGVTAVETPKVRTGVTSNWHLYVIRLNDANLDRNEVIQGLRQRGIGTSIHFLPVHYHPYYQERFGFCRGDYPVAEREFERLISLPLFPQMTDADVQRVVAAVEDTIDSLTP